MKFDVTRDTDYDQGRIGKDSPQPIEGAVFNAKENRWELEVETLEELMTVLRKLQWPVMLCVPLPSDECCDIPAMSICDDFAETLVHQNESGPRLKN